MRNRTLFRDIMRAEVGQWKPLYTSVTPEEEAGVIFIKAFGQYCREANDSIPLRSEDFEDACTMTADIMMLHPSVPVKLFNRQKLIEEFKNYAKE